MAFPVRFSYVAPERFGNRAIRVGPDDGGSPLLLFQHILLASDFNPVNYPFRLSKMAENGRG